MKTPTTENKTKWDLQRKVADRAESEFGRLDRMSLIMDLDSIPDLDLAVLLAAPFDDFRHDISGILQYMDRGSYPGKLTCCFRPRCCR